MGGVVNKTFKRTRDTLTSFFVFFSFIFFKSHGEIKKKKKKKKGMSFNHLLRFRLNLFWKFLFTHTKGHEIISSK